MAITLRHFKNMLFADEGDDAIPGTEVDSNLPEALSRRARFGEGRDRACPLCRLPALRIHLSAAGDQDYSGRISPNDKFAKVEKFPREFDIT